MPLRKLESDAEDRCRYERSRRNHSPLHRFSSLGSKSRITARWRAVSGGKLAAIAKFGHEIKNHCTLEGILEGFPATILKFGPEIKNHCTLEDVSRQNLAAIPKSGLEIKNRCTQEGVNREILASIRKSGPEIKNRCTQEDVSRQKPAVCPQVRA